jgi:aquaporin Z
MFGKKKLAMIAAEFIGTAVLTLAVISVRSSGIGYSFFVALGAGLAMAVLTFVLSSSSGAQFNPALTLGLWTARKVKTLPAVMYVVIQLLGAWAAYGVYVYLVKTHLQATGGHYAARVMLAEAVGMFIFAFGWAAAAAQKFEGGKLAATVGGSFALGIMVASLASNGVINPAVAIGTHAWDIWGSMGWGTYVLGPVVGGIVGVNLYDMLMSGKSVRSTASRKK